VVVLASVPLIVVVKTSPVMAIEMSTGTPAGTSTGSV
jgi:hypothetical protein